jgi:hypothetical protein
MYLASIRDRVTAHRRQVTAGVAAVAALSGMVFFATGQPAYAARVAATCTGGTSDSATIQAAINASLPGDAIVIKGPCTITATIKLLDNRTYRGDSRTGTVLTQAAGANLPAMLASDSWVNNSTVAATGEQIEDLTLDGDGKQNTGTVPLMLRAWDSRVYDVEIDDAPGNGIELDSLSQNLTHLASTSNLVNSIISDVFVQNSGGDGIADVDPDNHATDWVLERSWIAYSGGAGVDLANAAGWQIRDLHIYGSQLSAINADRCYGTGINDNYIEDFGAEGNAGSTYYGIRCTVQGDVANVVSGNKINHLTALPAAGTYVYLALDGVNYGTGRVAVTGNAIVGKGTARETGLSYAKGSYSLDVVSTGNLVDNVGTQRSVQTGVTVSAGV